MSHDPHVLIVGGNNAGLALALGLQRVGIRATVFERMDRHPPVEGGLHIAANGVRALTRLRVVQAVRQDSAAVERSQFRWKDGTVLVDVPTGEYSRAASITTLFIRRRNLTRALAAPLEPGVVQFGKAAVGLEQDDKGVTIRFADGTDARGDVVVGADGIRSTLRKQILGDVPIRYAGYADYGCVVEFEHPRFPLGSFSTWFGDGLRFGAAHIGNGEIYWAASIPREPGSSSPPTVDELTSWFGSWEDPIPQLVATATPERLFGADIGDIAPMDRWGHGRAVLMGDAAHATTPSTGRGASESLHDGVTLANALARVRDYDDHARVAGALQEWAESRKPQTRFVTRLSRHIGWVGKQRSERVVKTYLKATAFSVRQQFQRDLAIDVEELAARSPAWTKPASAQIMDDPLVDVVLKLHEEFFTGGRFEAVAHVFDPEFRYYHHAAPQGPMGVDQARATFANLRAAFPDLRVQPEVSARTGDTVLTLSVVSGTHVNAFSGIPPTGREFSQHLVFAMRFQDDKLIETRVVLDAFAVVEQLAALKAPTTFPKPVGVLLGTMGRRNPNRLPQE